MSRITPEARDKFLISLGFIITKSASFSFCFLQNIHGDYLPQSQHDVNYLFPIYNKVISGIKGILLLSQQHLVDLAHVFNNYSCLVTVSVKIMPNQSMS